MEQVIVKRLTGSACQIISCPEFIEDKVWKDNVVIGEKVRAEFFHSSWLGIIEKVCNENNVEFICH